MADPPVKIAKIAIGDGTIASGVVFELLPAVCSFYSVKLDRSSGYVQLTVIETYPQLIGYDPDVFNYFKTQYV